MKSSHLGALLLFFAALFTSCHKDVETGDNVEIISEFSVKVEKEIVSTIIGTVTDLENKPVEGATVQIYSKTVKTDKYGIFVFKNIAMDQQGTYIRVQKEGFILSGDYVYPSENTTNYSYIVLLPLHKNNLLDGKLGGTVDAIGGGRIKFQEGSIIDKDQQPYLDIVYVSAYYLDPKNPRLSDLMIGGLIADDKKNNTVALGTYGMIAVELRDKNGNEVFLDPNKKATITLPIPNGVSVDQVETWSFDEIKGRWKEEGLSKRIDNKLVFEVSHFSFWNCDAPFPLINLCGKVIDRNGLPLSNVQIKIEVEGIGVGYGVTSDNGIFCGKVPKGKELKISIFSGGCFDELTKVLVGPFANDVIIDPITYSSPNPAIMSGKVVCNGVAVSDAILYTQIAGMNVVFKVGADGKFNIDYTIYNCTEADFKVKAIDLVTGFVSDYLLINSNTDDNLVIDVCVSSCDFVPVMSFDCDNTIITITGGSGDFKYLWPDNPNYTTNATRKLSELDSISSGTILCVTVKDLSNGCTKEICKASPGYVQVFGEVNCGNGNGNGSILAAAFYNQNNNFFTYLWSNGATTRSIENIPQGTYCVTVTEPTNGCAAERCWEIKGFSFGGLTSCNENSFSFISSNFDSAYLGGFGAQQTKLDFPLILDVSTLYDYKLEGYFLVGSCYYQKFISLPHCYDYIKNLNIINTSCSTCNDGKITYSTDPTASCNDCVIGSVKLYKVNEIGNNIISSINALEKGEYYLVLTDLNTNCWIYHQKITIN
jgi:hypothetical protein